MIRMTGRARGIPLRVGACLALIAIAIAVSLATPAQVTAGTQQPRQAQSQPQAQPDQAAAARLAADRARAELAFLRAARTAIGHGKRADAEAVARARPAGDPAGAAILVRLASDNGRYDEAIALGQPAAAAAPLGDAALEFGLVLQIRGRSSDARRVLAPLVNVVGAGTPDSLLRAARAARALNQTRSANALFREAVAAAKDDPDANAAWGELFLEKHNRAEAATSFRAALARDADWAPAHAGLARALSEDDPSSAAASARRAIAIDAGLIDAHLYLAETALDGDRIGDARAAIDRALAVNPQHPAIHALVAAMAFVDGRKADFDAAMAKVLAVDPGSGDAYLVAAALAASNYRFDDAVALTRQATVLDPDNAGAWADLGMHLLRTGDEREARRALETAFRTDPYDVVTYNLLQMLDTLDRFDTVRTSQAIIRLQPDETPVMRQYAVRIVDEAIAAYSKRYQVTLPAPIIVEIFPKHDDFAVRNFGLPGMIGALGACFGRVVTLDSPRARPPGSFNWQATLWHELAHVFTLQLSKQRVPRWLTEGISVYEEGRVRPEWARDSELEFAQAYGAGRAMTLRDLNGGFTRAETVSLAYFEASLVVGLLVDRFGEEALRALVQAYADGSDTEAALRKATGQGLDDLQAAFNTRLQQRFAALGAAMQVPKGVEIPSGGDTPTLVVLAGKYGGSYPLLMAIGQTLVSTGAREQALATFERASALAPNAVGQGSARALSADLAERSGNTARALRDYKGLVADDHTNITAARKLAVMARRSGDLSALALAYDRIVTVDPFDASAHTALGQIALDRRDAVLAIREFTAALAAGPADVAPAHCDLAAALLLAGDRVAAKREVLAALELAPTYERAQELLLRIVEGK
jgi:tetratricopeptide (TPR) repeat protein